MRKALLMAGVLLALSATAASAAGVNLAWGNCRGSAGGTANTNLCATTGARTLVASFNAAGLFSKLEGEEVYIHFQETGPAVSCWWNYNQAPSMADFVPFPTLPTDANGLPTVNCAFSYWDGKAPTGNAAMQAPSGNTGQITAISAIAAGAGVASPSGESYAFGFRFLNSARNLSCAGCQNGVTLTLDRISLTSSTDPRQELTTADIGNSVNYNGGFTKVASKTWGAVKALYRN